MISVSLAPLQSISESLDSQEDSRIPVCTFPHLFFLSTRCGTRRGCFGALLWEGRAGILVFTGRQCVRAYRLRVAVSLQVFRCDVARVGSEPTLAFPMASGDGYTVREENCSLLHRETAIGWIPWFFLHQAVPIRTGSDRR